jgi:hypothetical protein
MLRHEITRYHSICRLLPSTQSTAGSLASTDPFTMIGVEI